MALTRKSLKEMGLTEEQITQVIEGHSETVNSLKEEIGRYREEAEKVPGLTKQLEDARKSADSSDYEGKYNALKQEYDDYKSNQEKAAATAKKREAYKGLLKEAGVSEKRYGAILKVTDFDGLEIDDNGKIKDKSKHLKSIKDEWSDFVTTEGTEGAETETPPGTSGGMTKDDILKITDTTERQQRIAENHELFGF